ncbi:hypothetical protein BGX27_009713 [Mortierella sp. AM989]|nr:hypothetical protein BGX27_009713 [Mortierella sp. AM989]
MAAPYRLNVRINSERSSDNTNAINSSERRFVTVADGELTIRELKKDILKDFRKHFAPDAKFYVIDRLENKDHFALNDAHSIKQVLEPVDVVNVVGLKKTKGAKADEVTQDKTSSSTSTTTTTTTTSNPSNAEGIKKKVLVKTGEANKPATDSSAVSAKKRKHVEDGSSTTKSQKESSATIPTANSTDASAANKRQKKKPVQETESSGNKTTTPTSTTTTSSPTKKVKLPGATTKASSANSSQSEEEIMKKISAAAKEKKATEAKEQDKPTESSSPSSTTSTSTSATTTESTPPVKKQQKKKPQEEQSPAPATATTPAASTRVKSKIAKPQTEQEKTADKTGKSDKEKAAKGEKVNGVSKDSGAAPQEGGAAETTSSLSKNAAKKAKKNATTAKASKTDSEGSADNLAGEDVAGSKKEKPAPKAKRVAYINPDGTPMTDEEKHAAKLALRREREKAARAIARAAKLTSSDSNELPIPSDDEIYGDDAHNNNDNIAKKKATRAARHVDNDAVLRRLLSKDPNELTDKDRRDIHLAERRKKEKERREAVKKALKDLESGDPEVVTAAKEILAPKKKGRPWGDGQDDKSEAAGISNGGQPKSFLTSPPSPPLSASSSTPQLQTPSLSSDASSLQSREPVRVKIPKFIGQGSDSDSDSDSDDNNNYTVAAMMSTASVVNTSDVARMDDKRVGSQQGYLEKKLTSLSTSYSDSSSTSSDSSEDGSSTSSDSHSSDSD